MRKLTRILPLAMAVAILVLAGIGYAQAVHNVTVTWTASAPCNGAVGCTATAGYNVYRSTTAGGPYSKISTGLVSGTSFTDLNVTNGVTYFYIVKAADAAGSESLSSNEATVSIPGQPNPATGCNAKVGP